MATDETSSQSTEGGSPLRWFLVLPAAFLGLFIGELVFTFIAQLFWEHTVFSLFAKPEMASWLSIAFIGPFCFVYSSATTAPSNKDKVAWLFVALWVAVEAVILYQASVERNHMFHYMSGAFFSIGTALATANSFSRGE